MCYQHMTSCAAAEGEDRRIKEEEQKETNRKLTETNRNESET